MLRSTAIVSSVALMQASSVPEVPSWPAAFSVNMTEQNQVGGPTTSVMYYYDSTQSAEKWVRPITGKLSEDGICQGSDAPCTDLVVGGNRWIIHPETTDCCLLGTTDHGCGPLNVDFIKQTAHEYKGRSMVEGVEADEWYIQGNGPNTYFSTVAPNPIPVKLVQGSAPNAFINIYDRGSFHAGKVAADVFAVPTYCSTKNVCKDQGPCAYGAKFASQDDLKRAKTKIPRKEYKGGDFGDMTSKLNAFLTEYNNVRDCAEWTLQELHEFQISLLDARSVELDEIYHASGDNRRIQGDADSLQAEWAALAKLASSLADSYKVMARDSHCHEAVMWFVHHLSETSRHRIARSMPVPLLPSSAHSCPGKASDEEQVVCNAYAKSVSCNQCHGEPKALVV